MADEEQAMADAVSALNATDMFELMKKVQDVVQVNHNRKHIFRVWLVLIEVSSDWSGLVFRAFLLRQGKFIFEVVWPFLMEETVRKSMLWGTLKKLNSFFFFFTLQ